MVGKRLKAALVGLSIQARFVLIALIALLVIVLAALVIGDDGREYEEKPLVGYMSSLPLAFGEGDFADALSAEGGGDAFYLRLSENYDMQPVDDLEQLGKIRADMLLLIQPRAFSAAENVAFDRWVRSGGEVLFLVDPALTRESALPLGDKRRPLFTSMASPLLNHWGLELTLPMDEVGARVERSVEGKSFETRAPGAFALTGKASSIADCDLSAKDLLARCTMGEGQAILLADADLVDPILWQESGLLGQNDGAVRLIEELMEELTAASR